MFCLQSETQLIAQYGDTSFSVAANRHAAGVPQGTVIFSGIVNDPTVHADVRARFRRLAIMTFAREQHGEYKIAF